MGNLEIRYKVRAIKEPIEMVNNSYEYTSPSLTRLTNKLPDAGILHETNIKNRIFYTIFPEPVTINEVQESTTSFKSGKASGFIK